MLSRCSRSFALVALVAVSPAPSAAQPAPGEPQTFLRKHVQLDEAQIAAIDRGEVVTRLLPTAEGREIAAFGAVRIRATRAAFLSRFKDVVAFKKGAAIPEAGLFSRPPRLEDLAELTLDPEDVDSLKSCTKGDCDVKLPASIMERFRREVTWSAPDARARATALAKQMAVEYVAAYLSGGSAAMGEYHDKKKPLAMAAEFHELIRRSPYVFEYVPELHRYRGGGRVVLVEGEVRLEAGRGHQPRHDLSPGRAGHERDRREADLRDALFPGFPGAHGRGGRRGRRRRRGVPPRAEPHSHRPAGRFPRRRRALADRGPRREGDGGGAEGRSRSDGRPGRGTMSGRRRGVSRPGPEPST
jgi:hypothetical protein